MERREYLKLFEQGKLFEQAGQWQEACDVYDTIIRQVPDFIQAYRRRTECLVRLQRWPEAILDVEKVFSSGTRIFNRDLKRKIMVLGQQGKAAQASLAIAEFSRHWLEENRENIKQGLTIFTAAAPKTGSTSMSVALAEATGWSRVNFLCYANSPLGAGIPSFEALDLLKNVGIVNHCHLLPETRVLDEMAKRPWIKTVVQFRHPAETLLSTVDMMIRDKAPMIFARLPYSGSERASDMIDWSIENYLPHLVDWMKKWVQAIDNNHPAILGWTTLDEIRAEGQDWVARNLLISAGIDVGEPCVTEPRRTGLRLQEDNEVKYTDQQEEKLMDSIPEVLKERFGW